MGRSVEHFTAAAASGGRYGSAVYASVPCDQRGIGSAILSGRGAMEPGDLMPPEELRCSPTTVAGGYNYAYTSLQTTWTLKGDVVGGGSDIDRLFVFDFPKP